MRISKSARCMFPLAAALVVLIQWTTAICVECGHGLAAAVLEPACAHCPNHDDIESSVPASRTCECRNHAPVFMIEQNRVESFERDSAAVDIAHTQAGSPYDPGVSRAIELDASPPNRLHPSINTIVIRC